jgi:hypothetical protein
LRPAIRSWVRGSKPEPARTWPDIWRNDFWQPLTIALFAATGMSGWRSTRVSEESLCLQVPCLVCFFFFSSFDRALCVRIHAKNMRRRLRSNLVDGAAAVAARGSVATAERSAVQIARVIENQIASGPGAIVFRLEAVPRLFPFAARAWR